MIALIAYIHSMGMDISTRKLLKKFGHKMLELRLQRKWSLEDAEEHGFPTFQHLQTIEAGKKNITFSTVVNLSKLYKLPISELFKDL